MPDVFANPPLRSEGLLPDRIKMANARRNHTQTRDGLTGLGSPNLPALAFLELSSISRGLYLTDLILKKAPVRIVTSQPVSSGKHVILFTGDVASVDESHRAAVESADGALLRDILIAGVHEQLAPFLDSLWALEPTRVPLDPKAENTIGIVESATLAGTIVAADRALKAADVFLSRMRLGQGIGGHGYFILGGRQEEVEAALEAGSECLKNLDSLIRVDIVPRPREDVLVHF